MTTPFRLDTCFYQIPGSQPEGTFGAIMEVLLKTRMKLNLETNKGIYDEDVNAYLAGLLLSYIDPTYLQAISQVVSAYELDIFEEVRKSEDRYHTYWIYKVNADDLLVSLGIFKHFREQPRGDLEKLKRYYVCASEYQRRIYGKSTAVGEIQEKLADRTERYLTILSGARGEYLHFMDHLHPEQMAELGTHLDEFERELPLKEKQNEFLDAYLEWKAGTRDNPLRQKLLHLVQELKNLDATFDAEQLLGELLSP